MLAGRWTLKFYDEQIRVLSHSVHCYTLTHLDMRPVYTWNWECMGSIHGYGLFPITYNLPQFIFHFLWSLSPYWFKKYPRIIFVFTFMYSVTVFSCMLSVSNFLVYPRTETLILFFRQDKQKKYRYRCRLVNLYLWHLPTSFSVLWEGVGESDISSVSSLAWWSAGTDSLSSQTSSVSR